MISVSSMKVAGLCVSVIASAVMLFLYCTGNLDSLVKVVNQETYIVGNSAREKENITMLEKKNISVYKNDNLPYKVTDKMFYLFSVIAHQDENNTWDKLFFTGWEVRSVFERKYICCYMFENGKVVDGISAYKLGKVKRSINARQVVCDIRAITMKGNLKWASLCLLNETCQDVRTYHTIVYRQRENTKQFAIYGNILYGQKDAVQLIEWMEYHKYLGVSRAVVYTYPDLNDRARKVLSYYEHEGVLEAVPYPYVPLHDQFPRFFAVGGNKVMWQDEKVALFDTQQRLRPYTYFAVIDTDEFIVPRRENVTNLIDLVDYLLNKTENCGTFIVYREVHLFDWNKTNNNTNLQIAQYGYHTIAVTYGFKHIHVSSRLQEGAIKNHNTRARRPFSRVVASPKDDVVIKHFRTCRKTWKNCPESFKRYHDFSMSILAPLIEPKVMEVRSKLGL